MRSPSNQGSAAIESNRQCHDLLAEAQASLYSLLLAAQSGRERDWAAHLGPALASVREAIDRHIADVTAPNGLYEELQIDAPWLSRRIDRLLRHLERLGEQACDLGEKLLAMEQGVQPEAHGIRADAERLLAGIRDLVTQENELVYERWHDPPALD